MSYQIVAGDDQGLEDVARFIDLLNRLDQYPMPAVRSLFDSEAELTVTRAPGRLDVMGGFGDYSGVLVLQLPLQAATLVALQQDPERRVRIISLGAANNQRSATFDLALETLAPLGNPIDYVDAHRIFTRKQKDRWVSYIMGVFLVLMHECGVQFSRGVRLLIDSNVPEGKGVSSSAALEVAVMQAVSAAFELKLSARKVALLCQKAENLVRGAPCGVMDQMTSSCGKAHHLLALLCQPAELRNHVELRGGLTLWGIDSGIRHVVSGSDYTSVRAGTFMGYRMLAQMAGFKIKYCGNGNVQIGDENWHGYLANLTPVEFEMNYAPHLPLTMKGQVFLEKYQGTSDPVTQIDPEITYPIFYPVKHPVYEHVRVMTFLNLLKEADGQRRKASLGALMYESHASYTACGLGSDGTDLLVHFVQAAGAQTGLYGAKISGGGSGGTVVILGRQGADDVIQRIAKRYENTTGYRPVVFSGSTSGAADFGYLRLKPNA